MTYAKNGKWGKTQRFLSEVVAAHESDDCLRWPFGYSGQGYGMMWRGDRVHPAHRLVCEDHHGAAPTDKHQAAHGCGNRWCCNPRHLRWATRSQNEADKLKHGTHDRGERHVGSKYTEAQVMQLHNLRKTHSVRSAALLLGMNYSVAYKISRGESWPHTMPGEDCAA